MRITVRRVLELLATYPDRATLLAEYPFLEPEDLQQALRFAAATLDDESLGIDRVAPGVFYWTRDSQTGAKCDTYSAVTCSC